MEKEKIVAEESVVSGEYTIVPIIRKSLHCIKNKDGKIFVGIKHPLALLVTVGSNKKLHIIRDGISIEQLVNEFPELENL